MTSLVLSLSSLCQDYQVKESKEYDPFESLPNEVLDYIFSFLHPAEIFYIRRTCKRFLSFSENLIKDSYIKLKVTCFFVNNTPFLEKAIQEGYNVSIKTFIYAAITCNLESLNLLFFPKTEYKLVEEISSPGKYIGKILNKVTNFFFKNVKKGDDCLNFLELLARILSLKHVEYFNSRNKEETKEKGRKEELNTHITAPTSEPFGYQCVSFEERLFNELKRKALDAIVKAGNLEVAKPLFEIINEEQNKIEEKLRKKGERTRNYYLLNTHFNPCKSAFLTDDTAINGDVEMFKFLISKGVPYNLCYDGLGGKCIVYTAAKFGHLEFVRFCLENLEDFKDRSLSIHALDYACYSQNEELIEYLKSKGYEYSYMAVEVASKTKNFELVEDLVLNKRLEVTERALLEAVKHGNFETLKFLYKQNNEALTRKVLEIAEIFNHWEITEWIKSKGIEPFNGDNIGCYYETGDTDRDINWNEEYKKTEEKDLYDFGEIKDLRDMEDFFFVKETCDSTCSGDSIDEMYTSEELLDNPSCFNEASKDEKEREKHEGEKELYEDRNIDNNENSDFKTNNRNLKPKISAKHLEKLNKLSERINLNFKSRKKSRYSINELLEHL